MASSLYIILEIPDNSHKFELMLNGQRYVLCHKLLSFYSSEEANG